MEKRRDSNKKLKYLLSGFFIFIIFFVFSLLVGKDIFNTFDFDTTVKLQDNLDRRVDVIFSFFSLVGNFEFVTLFLLILLVIIRKLRSIFVLPIFAFLHVIELYGKYFLEHLPPPQFLLRTEKLVEMPQFYVRSVNSYPSGHSARAAFISVIVIILLSRSKRLNRNMKYILIGIVLVYDLVMFTSRIYLGEHWATDVIGGGFLGLSLGLISLLLL